MHFETITKLLNLPDIIVVGALDCPDDHLHLVVALSGQAAPPICSCCGAVHTTVHSKGQMRAEDLPLLGRRVFLYLDSIGISIFPLKCRRVVLQGMYDVI